MHRQSEQAPLLSELRQEPRKVLRSRAEISGDSIRSMQASTTDISMSGLGLVVSAPLSPGQICIISFQAFSGNALEKVLLKGKVARCTLNGLEGYRTGIEIMQIHPDSVQTIKRLLQ